jgi:16S rRNA (guanine527-N7)-methyltransferase
VSRPASPSDPGGGPRRVPGPAALVEVLRRQRARDVLGSDDLDALRAHSRGFAAALEGAPTPVCVVDLGSGGGVPGLVLAVEVWPAASFTLVDASQRRCTYLELCVADLDLGARVVVVWGRAEEVGRDDARRGAHDLVVARSFGPPAVVAECAAPLLEVDGHLVVSEPPGSVGDRWDPVALARLGLEVEATVAVDGRTYTRLRQVTPCPPGYPRRPGIPAKRPLF